MVECDSSARESAPALPYPRRTLATVTTPARFHDLTFQYRTNGVEALARHDEAEFVQRTEHARVRASEGHVGRRASRRLASEPPLSDGLNPCPETDAPATATPSTVKSPY